jgi:hypothetical protein
VLIPVPSQFRNTTPGSIIELLGNKRAPYYIHKNPGIIDPSHPAARHSRGGYKVFPQFSNANITIRAFPKAVLRRPDVPWPDPPYPAASDVKWSEQLERLRKETGPGVRGVNAGTSQIKVDSIDMSMACIVGKKATHKSAVIRGKLVGRLKIAVSLIITRGADVHSRGDRKGLEGAGLVLNDDVDINRQQWISQGHSTPLLIVDILTDSFWACIRLDLPIHSYPIDIPHAVPRVNFLTSKCPWQDSFSHQTVRGKVGCRSRRYGAGSADTYESSSADEGGIDQAA